MNKNNLNKFIQLNFIFLILSISQSSSAMDLNLLCTFKSFCEERVIGNCQTATSKNFDSVQHVKLSKNFVEYWGDVFDVTIINDSLIKARRLEKYPNTKSFNESIFILNRYTGTLDLTHNYHAYSMEASKHEISQINRVKYECAKAAPKF